MANPRFQRLVDIVSLAETMDPDRVETYLYEACADDTTLLVEARELLGYAGSDTGLKITRSLQQRAGEASRLLAKPEPPEQIGPYRVLRSLGDGGMGSVYLAEQTEPLQRLVAVKVIRAGLIDPEIVSRFTAERQALARMSHPGIAQVFDADCTDDGVPYFVMEYVDGAPINEYCVQQQIDLPARLKLFQQLCLAIGHAHFQGIVHRDLKPANLLVTEIDGEPRVKVIDFGIAKFVDNIETAGEARTRMGMIMGTPDFMSPEQADGSLAIDLRTDIYALGAVLYYLLTQSPPFELAGLSFTEIRRVLLESTPRLPSQRLNNKVERREVQGDIDNVVLKALSVDPNDRYTSAQALALDIENVLSHQPVTASPPNWANLGKKFYRRHRLGVYASVIVLFSVVAGSVASIIGYLRAEEQRRIAVQEAEVATQTSDFVTTMLAAAQPENAKGEDVSVREILDVAAAQLDSNADMAPEVESKIRRTLGESYSALAYHKPALQQLTQSLQMAKVLYGDESAHVRGLLGALSTLHFRAGDIQTALDVSKELLALREAAYGKNNGFYTETLTNVGSAYADLGQYQRGETLVRDALVIDRALAVDQQGLENLVYTLNNLATILVNQEKFDEAIELHKESLALREELFGKVSAATAVATLNLGEAQAGRRDWTAAYTTLNQALSLIEKVFGYEHPRTGAVYLHLASVVLNQQRYPEALDLAETGLAIVKRTEGEDSLRYILQKAAVGHLRVVAGEVETGGANMLEAYPLAVQRLGEDNPRTNRVAGNIADYYVRQGDVTQAELWRSRSHITQAE